MDLRQRLRRELAARKAATLEDVTKQRDALRAACEAVAAFCDCEDAADWKDAWGRLTRQAAAALALCPKEQSCPTT